MTVQNTFVLAGGAMQDRELSYVQASRARGDVRFFTDEMEAGEDLAQLSRQVETSRRKDLALEHLPGESPENPLAVLEELVP